MNKLGCGLPTLFFCLLLALVAGLVLYVEAHSAAAPGVVVGKREEIALRRSFWARRLFLDVRYQPLGASLPQQAALAIDTQRFDRTSVGAAVQVRYLPQPDAPWLSEIATRLGDQPPLGSLRAQLSSQREITVIVVVVIWLTLLAAFAIWRRGWLAMAVCVFIGAGLYVASNWPQPAPTGPQLASLATVRATHAIDTLLEGRRRAIRIAAAQPYTIVELSFVPAGMAGPVIAVDMIDAGSVPGLERGASVPIRYSAADQRWAQIDGATRTYAWKNLAHLGWHLLPFVVVALGLVAIGRVRAARRRQAVS